MNEPLYSILIMAAGLLLGTLFFGGLWLTVRKAGRSKIPSLLVLGSFILRMIIVLLGFYFISAGNWRSMLIAFAGFMIARFLVMHFTRARKSDILKRENYHET